MIEFALHWEDRALSLSEPNQAHALEQSSFRERTGWPRSEAGRQSDLIVRIGYFPATPVGNSGGVGYASAAEGYGKIVENLAGQ